MTLNDWIQNVNSAKIEKAYSKQRNKLDHFRTESHEEDKEETIRALGEREERPLQRDSEELWRSWDSSSTSLVGAHGARTASRGVIHNNISSTEPFQVLRTCPHILITMSSHVIHLHASTLGGHLMYDPTSWLLLSLYISSAQAPMEPSPLDSLKHPSTVLLCETDFPESLRNMGSN